MKRSIDEHAERFSAVAAEYDEQQDSDEYAACASMVIDAADPGPEETVLDLGTGTGAIALALASDAGRVIGRDISEGMLAEARRKADAAGHENVAFGEGRFREPNVDAAVDVVVSNFAMHHLADDEKREAIEVIADLDPRRFVLGDVMLSGEIPEGEEAFSPEVDDPATVGVLVETLTDAGFSVSSATLVSDQYGVLVADR
ncbi:MULTISPECIES: class I SAM-dependent methyltransferase [Halolamina]|uniref:Methyltransferase domain-containing protein n=1 Tax=Halolamina pelagica TaxID=699431 RepID=A0A1I5NKS1_9EURY|nr:MULTISPECIES: class I SAM-dependent methyltransferase [Halolamina]NHX36361.1 class I SAM-dependent methyltransferase [Halolamina sp. R1-12]SFP22230.1 Methyltransferase domain-containing protein [Halolamina pelagica]